MLLCFIVKCCSPSLRAPPSAAIGLPGILSLLESAWTHLERIARFEARTGIKPIKRRAGERNHVFHLALIQALAKEIPRDVEVDLSGDFFVPGICFAPPINETSMIRTTSRTSFHSLYPTILDKSQIGKQSSKRYQINLRPRTASKRKVMRLQLFDFAKTYFPDRVLVANEIETNMQIAQKVFVCFLVKQRRRTGFWKRCRGRGCSITEVRSER